MSNKIKNWWIIAIVIISIGIVYSLQDGGSFLPDTPEVQAMLVNRGALGQCTDSDGLNTASRGFTLFGRKYYEDRCLNQYILAEYTCNSGGRLDVKKFSCPKGESCLNGACKKGVIPSVCSDSDGGNNINEMGTVSYFGRTYPDSCGITNSHVNEYVCSYGKPKLVAGYCPSRAYCQNGACKKPLPIIIPPQNITVSGDYISFIDQYDINITNSSGIFKYSLIASTPKCGQGLNLYKKSYSVVFDGSCDYLSKYPKHVYPGYGSPSLLLKIGDTGNKKVYSDPPWVVTCSEGYSSNQTHSFITKSYFSYFRQTNDNFASYPYDLSGKVPTGIQNNKIIKCVR